MQNIWGLLAHAHALLPLNPYDLLEGDRICCFSKNTGKLEAVGVVPLLHILHLFVCAFRAPSCTCIDCLLARYAFYSLKFHNQDQH